MNPTTADTRLADIALGSAAQAAILDRHRLDFCCGGGRSLRDACHAAGIEVSRILAELDAQIPNQDAAVASAAVIDWNNRPVDQVIDYIVDKHHAYTRQSIAKIDPLVRRVVATHGERHPELAAVGTSFAALTQELAPHLLREERVLFPYIRALGTGGRWTRPPFGTVANPVRMMMAEHDTAAAHLENLKATTNDFAVPSDACASYRALYTALADLRADLLIHVSLENNVLFPRALALEARLHGAT